jgi:hypothetical protein
MVKKSEVLLAEEALVDKIYFIRGEKVMLDSDLATLYGVETKHLKRQVKRNMERFPTDFMFELNAKEFENWRRQFGTSNFSNKMGLRYAPYAFTEQGVAQLSSVINGAKAIAVNIQIIRLFTKMRKLLLSNNEFLVKLEQLEKQGTKHNDEIQHIFDILLQLLQKPNKPRETIGYKFPVKDDK